MLGTALRFGGVSGEDRFYIPVKARKNRNQRKQAQRAKKGETESVDSTLKSKVVVLENRNSYEPSYSSTEPHSSQILAIKNWHNKESIFHGYRSRSRENPIPQ